MTAKKQTWVAIETSCDETSVAILESGPKLLSNIVYSQIKKHREFGGVVPEYASRMHTEVIHEVFEKALKEAKKTIDDLDYCAVTYGPGLEGSLLVGLAMAKMLAYGKGIPLVPVNHLHGHIYANFLSESPPSFPFICLIVSGGHTQLIRMNAHYDLTLLGQTRDDAAGEAFDKVARVLGLPYPGGPEVEKEARKGNPKAFNFPRPMKQSPTEFSFSGLKTAVIQTLHKLKESNTPYSIADICASFQAAVLDCLVDKCRKNCEKEEIKTLVLSGGVTANQALRQAFEQMCDKEQITLLIPEPSLCTDNAGMIGAAGYYYYQKVPKSQLQCDVKPSLGLCDFNID